MNTIGKKLARAILTAIALVLVYEAAHFLFAIAAWGFFPLRVLVGVVLLPFEHIADQIAYKTLMFNRIVGFLQTFGLMRFYFPVPEFAARIKLVLSTIYFAALIALFRMSRSVDRKKFLGATIISVLPFLFGWAYEYKGIPTMLAILRNPGSTAVFAIHRDNLANETLSPKGKALSESQIKSVYDLLKIRVALDPLLRPTAGGCMNLYSPDTEIDYVKGAATVKIILGIEAYNLDVVYDDARVSMNCERAYLDPAGHILTDMIPHKTPLELAIQNIRAPGSVAIVLAALNDSDPAIRAEAVGALRFVDDPKVAQPLIHALADSDSSVRREAASALSGVRDQSANQALIGALGDPDPQVRIAATSSLGFLKANEACPQILKELSDQDPGVRRAAIDSLGRMEYTPAENEFTKALNDADASVRARAAAGLAQIHSDKAFEPLFAGLKSSSDIVRWTTVTTLAKTKNPKIVGPLIPMLKDPYPLVRQVTAEALADLHTPERTRALLGALKDSDENVRGAVSRSLLNNASTGEDNAVILTSNDADVRLSIFDFASTCQDRNPTWRFAVIRALSDTDSRVRAKAARCAGNLWIQEAVPALKKLMKDDAPAVRVGAIWGLHSLYKIDASDDMIAALRDPDSTVRSAAAAALGDHPAKKNVGPLIECLKDPNPEVRRWAAQSLGMTRDPDGREPLHQLIDDPDPKVRDSAQNALKWIAK